MALVRNALVSLVVAAVSPLAHGAGPTLQCNLGPAIELVGGNSWLVYGCSDGKSVVVVAGTPNPAAPFYFIVSPGREGVEVQGEGTGAKSATQSAYDQLAAMSAAQLQALRTKAVSAHPR